MRRFLKLGAFAAGVVTLVLLRRERGVFPAGWTARCSGEGADVNGSVGYVCVPRRWRWSPGEALLPAPEAPGGPSRCDGAVLAKNRKEPGH